jgi:hypothetical protein
MMSTLEPALRIFIHNTFFCAYISGEPPAAPPRSKSCPAILVSATAGRAAQPCPCPTQKKARANKKSRKKPPDAASELPSSHPVNNRCEEQPAHPDRSPTFCAYTSELPSRKNNLPIQTEPDELLRLPNTTGINARQRRLADKCQRRQSLARAAWCQAAPAASSSGTCPGGLEATSQSVPKVSPK